MPAPDTLSIAITELVDFSCRRGDLMPASLPPVTQMQGLIAHQRLQVRRKREPGYQAELAVSLPMQWHDTHVILRGRIDGVWIDEPRIEEIKTIGGDAARLSQQTRELHWAQAQCYAFCLCTMHAFSSVCVQVTYADIDGSVIETGTRQQTLAELTTFIDTCIGRFVEWQQFRRLHVHNRNVLLHHMHWPFAAFRQPQRVIAETVYKAIHLHSELLCEAPTGTGKTMAHLFPALKALAKSASAEQPQRIVWLTAKTSAQHTVLQALHLLHTFDRDAAVAGHTPGTLRVLQLAARDKLCFCRAENSDLASPCPYTIGYYDRLPQARRAACDGALMDTPAVLMLAQRFTVCPFQLALDLIAEADIVIGDVNYIFDPLIALTALTGDAAANTVLLIDEAHNLIDRSRDMYSATISVADILAFAAELKTVSKSAGIKIQRLLKQLTTLDTANTAFTTLATVFRAMLEHYSAVAAQTDMPDALGERLRPIIRAMVIAELAGDRHRLLITRDDGNPTWHIANLDPSLRNAATLALYRSAILFSGTLAPLDYSRAQLGLASDTPTLQIASPFAQDNLHVSICTHIDTRLRQRADSAQSLADLIAMITQQRVGNYLCAFPSYQYLEQVQLLLLSQTRIRIVAQSPAWSDIDRAAVIALLKSGSEPTLVLGIIGGSLGESIDLPGDSLIGVIIIGVGLHAPDITSDARRQYYDSHHSDGYALAYRYPGWQRVVQTAGRLIRSESDKGVLVLVDPRHARRDYQRLWPAHWRVAIATSNAQCVAGIAHFWQQQVATGSPD